MKFVKVLFCILLLSSLLTSNCYATEAANWYIVKRGNETPSFPADAEFISLHNGFYIDKNCTERGDKILYLTFDAGYENGNIESILDTMKEENVTGAFFILSNLVYKNPDLVRRMAKEGHLICNHTSNHKDVTTLTDEQMLQNLSRLESIYRDCTGTEMEKIFRFPEGRYNREKVLACEAAGYKTVFWSMAYADWDNSRQPSEKEAIKTLLSTTHNGAIILLHPTSATNAQILPVLIRAWKAQGYKFGSLNDL